MTDPFDAAPKSSFCEFTPGRSVADQADAVLREFVLNPVPPRMRGRATKSPSQSEASVVSTARVVRRRGSVSNLAAEAVVDARSLAQGGARAKSKARVEVRRQLDAPDPLASELPVIELLSSLQEECSAPATEAAPRATVLSRSESAARRSKVPATAAKLVVGTENYAHWRAYWRSVTDENRNQLVESYQNLVREIVGRFAARLPRSVDRGDLATAANVGLIAAITSFDPARSVRFEAYADRRIRGALLDELRCQDWLPRPWRQRFEQHKRIVERLRSGLSREPHDYEVAEQLALPMDEYQAIFGVGLPGTPAAARAHEDSDESAAGIDVVADPRSDAPDDRLTRDELMGLVAQRLTVQEYRIVYLKYWEDLPMRTIGGLTGLSESRVCKIHTRLIGRLRDRLGVQV